MSSDRKRKWDQPGGDDASPNKAAKTESDAFEAASKATTSPSHHSCATLTDRWMQPFSSGAAAARIAAAYAPQKSESVEPMEGKPGKDGKEFNDPDFIKDIEINDHKNRYLLTKGQTQQEVNNISLAHSELLIPTAGGREDGWMERMAHRDGSTGLQILP